MKCKRIDRSVLAAEFYARTSGFDHGTALKTNFDNILGQSVPLIICTNFRSLFDCLVELGITQEKRLMIDIMCLLEDYEKRETAEIH